MIAAASLAHQPVRDTSFFSRIYLDFLDESRFLKGRFACSFRDIGCWSGLAGRRRDLAAGEDFWRQLAALHERLGAPPAARENLSRLASGEAVAVITGQQPDPLGGPLFTFHKVATAVALARSYQERAGVPAVPVFWVASEDSDFEEIRTVRLLGPELESHELALERGLLPENGMVGEIETGRIEELWREALGIWSGLPGHGVVGQWLGEARERARDLGEVQALLMLRAFGASGLVTLDPRLSQFRLAASGLYRRYLEHHARVRESADRAGEALETEGYERSIPPITSEFALYRIADGTRVKTDLQGAREALAAARPLTGNVVLRPLVQDALLPTALQIAGPGEVAYLAQLGEVYQVLGVPPAVAFPRATATWLPESAVQLVAERGLDPWRLVRDPDSTLREMYAGMVPAAAREGLERLRRGTSEELTEFAATAKQIDRSLPQLVDSARGKVDYQFRRISDGLISKVRSQFDHAHPRVGRLRHALLPQDRPQERRLAWLDVVARGGLPVLERAATLAATHVRKTVAGENEHHLIPLGGGERR